MSSNRDFDREVTFEIVEEIGVIATHSTGWKKELNLVSWNGGRRSTISVIGIRVIAECHGESR